MSEAKANKSNNGQRLAGSEVAFVLGGGRVAL